MAAVVLFFFFSSRRRHTRFDCDWSSDVCSSDLLRADGVEELGLLFVVDEEQGSIGARVANRHPLARECRWLIAGEPTENKLAVGSKGSLRLTPRTDGTGGGAPPPAGRPPGHPPP